MIAVAITKMTTLELNSKKREIFGKKVKILRNQGLIPAVVYPTRSGGKEGSVSITVDGKEFGRVFKSAGETTLIKLFIAAPEGSESHQGRDGGNIKNVLIHDISRDSVTDEIKHIDFYEVKMDEKIDAKIPLVFIRDAPAVSDLGGILVKAMQEFAVRALPADLPHEIEVDISVLKTFDDNITVKDIKLPKNVERLENISASVVSVAPPRSEAEIEALSGKIEEKVEEVATESEEKAAATLKEEKEKTIK